MKLLGKTEDRVVARLVRAQLSREISCAGFDPDLANAYVERALTTAEVARFEGHLAVCAICRTGVAKLAIAELPKGVALSEKTAGWAGRIRSVGLLLLRPQWGLAAAALIVLAVALPLFLRQPSRSLETHVAVQQDLPAAGAVSVDEYGDSKSRENEPESLGPTAAPRTMLTEQARLSEAPAEGASAGAPSAAPPGEPAVIAAAPPTMKDAAAGEPKQAEEAKKAETDKTAVATTERAEAASPPQPVRDDAKLDRIDEKRALNVSGESSRSADTRVLRPGTVSDQPTPEKEKTGTVRPNDTVAKVPEPESAASGGRAVMRAPNRTPSRETGPDRTARARGSESLSRGDAVSERRVGRKVFRLANGIWIDRSYKADMEFPAVPMAWGSDLYNERIQKDEGLRAYLSEFRNSEHVILVHKGTIYKLVPSQK